VLRTHTFPFFFSSWWWLLYRWAETCSLWNFNLLYEDCFVWRYPYYLADIYFNFRGLYILNIPEGSDFGSGGNVLLWNSCTNIPNNTASQPTRQYSTLLARENLKSHLFPSGCGNKSPNAGYFYSLHASHMISPSRIPLFAVLNNIFPSYKLWIPSLLDFCPACRRTQWVLSRRYCCRSNWNICVSLPLLLTSTNTVTPHSLCQSNRQEVEDQGAAQWLLRHEVFLERAYRNAYQRFCLIQVEAS
jgi:hypothetical protein